MRFSLGALFTAILVGCGGGGDGGDGGGDETTFALPGVSILSVQAAGPGRDITVIVEITAPVDGVPTGVLALAQTLRLASTGDVLNDIVTTTSGTPDRNGIVGLTPPQTGSIQVTFTIAGDRPTLLPAETGIQLEVRIGDGFMQAEDTFTFDIDPFGPINEPTCELLSPTGGTLGGQVPLTVSFDDLEGDPASATFTYAVAGGARLPCTLVAGSSPFLGGYTPTDPANGFTSPASQIAGVPTPTTVQVTWDSLADGVGLGGRVPVEIRVLTEDGTTAGTGPFFACAAGCHIDNSPPAAVTAGPQVVPLGDAALLDPGGILGQAQMFLGTSARLRIGGMGFGPGSVITLAPAGGVLLAGTEMTSPQLVESALRVTPDGPDLALDETGQSSHLGGRLASVDGMVQGLVDVADHGQLQSLSSDRFTVAPGGRFNVAVQVPSSIQGDPVVAYAAALRFDAGAVRVTALRGGTHPDFTFTPQSIPSQPTAASDRLVVFVDAVSRTQQIDPVMNVANVELTLTAGVIPGTRIHVWLEPTDQDNVLLTQGGAILFGGGPLSLLGTSVAVE